MARGKYWEITYDPDHDDPTETVNLANLEGVTGWDNRMIVGEGANPVAVRFRFQIQLAILNAATSLPALWRGHASKLHGIVSMILGYEFWQQLFQLPEKGNVLKACGELRRLSGLHLEDKKNRTIPGPYASRLRVVELLMIRSLDEGEKRFLATSDQIASGS
jgi:hypothetical protein